MENHSFLRFYGGMKIDAFKISKDNLNKEEILKDYQLLTIDTILMNNYMKKLEADYISSDSIVSDRGFYLYKKTPFQSYYTFVGKLEGNAFIFSDYNVVNNEYYHYLATLEKIGIDGVPSYVSYENLDESDNLRYIKSSWNNFSICDLNFNEEENQYYASENVWLLNCNVESNDITQNTSVTTWDTLSQYQKISTGVKKYDSGTMSCLLGEVSEYLSNSKNKNVYGYTEKMNTNSIYGWDNEKEIAWKEFISNGKLKLFKDTKGNKWIIQILENNKRKIDYNVIGKVTTISFDWAEVENSDLYPIIGENKV